MSECFVGGQILPSSHLPGEMETRWLRTVAEGAGMIEGTSKWNLIAPGQSVFDPCYILTCWPSVNLPAFPARRVSAHTHSLCVWLCVVWCQDSGSLDGQFIARAT